MVEVHQGEPDGEQPQLSPDATGSVPQDPPVYPDLDLSPEHKQLLADSAISPAVAHARGYRTITKKAELAERGFKRNQRQVPALLVPIYGVHGDLASYQSRPVTPRIKDGKPLKYETPAGTRMVLDVPKHARAWLRDPRHDLFITEGARKADAGVSAGLCTIAVLGVWNWRGQNEFGGKQALADWDAISLDGRKVYLAFDSDVMDKPQVHHALSRLKAMLESRHAEVQVIYLPAGEGGAKQGLDDYLASGKSVLELMDLASPELRRPPDAGEGTSRHRIKGDGSTVCLKPNRQGELEEVLLANFSARIVKHIIVDDGVTQSHEFRVSARIGAEEVQVDVPAEEFATMGWVAAKLGPKAIVEAGHMTRDQFRVAIQDLSAPNVETQHVYTHLGWRRVEDRWVYLHASGAIGAEGALDSVETRLDSPLDRFVLPSPPEGDERREALSAGLSLLDGLAPDRVMFSLFAVACCTLMESSGWSTHLEGSTGVRKTEIAALVQRFWGSGMDAVHLPESWTSTGNKLESVAFSAKDALLVVDDYKPEGSPSAVYAMQDAAARLLRGQGNRAGRGRLRADSTSMAARYPRGSILSTGESVPGGHSLRSRVLVLQLSPGDVSLEALTRCQGLAPKLSGFMSLLVMWLLNEWQPMKAEFDRRANAERNLLLPRLPHGRTATIGSELVAGLGVMIRFLVEHEAIPMEEAARLLERGQRAILEAVERQVAVHEQADPGEEFLERISSLLAAGSAHLVDLQTGDVPQDEGSIDDELVRALGWKRAVLPGINKGKPTWSACGQRIGFARVRTGEVYLILDVAFRAAQDVGREGADSVLPGRAAITRSLAEKGLILSTDGGQNRRTKRKRVGGEMCNTLHLQIDVLLGGLRTLRTGSPDQPEEGAEGGPGGLGAAGSGSSGNGTATCPAEEMERRRRGEAA